jgi:hypothetical protein
VAPLHLLPELVEDVIVEILHRMAPEKPPHLIRASLVCKPWCPILSNPEFLHHYRRYHWTPPMLGFFHGIHGATKSLHCFAPTMASSSLSSLMALNCSHWLVLECRHGHLFLQ